MRISDWSSDVCSSDLFAAFTLAGILIFLYLIVKRSRWQTRNVVAGLALGLLNFGNIYFYIRAHQVFPENPTLVFSAMNIGVISLGTLVGAGLFKEKLRWEIGRDPSELQSLMRNYTAVFCLT